MINSKIRIFKHLFKHKFLVRFLTSDGANANLNTSLPYMDGDHTDGWLWKDQLERHP